MFTPVLQMQTKQEVIFSANKGGSCVAFVCVKSGKVVSYTLVIANKTPIKQ